MSKPVITVENLSKAYRIGLKEEVPDTLMSAMTGFMKAPLKKFHELRRLNTFGHAGGEEDDLYWALKDVSFEVQEGEVLGVIGRNGAGKSTLLKILSRITEPTSGRAVIRGRVSSLLEVGTGFHPELSGRENVYLNGTILGMTKREIDSKFDEIVDFSGIEKFLDTPIKRYSSGMKVRLAFAVAAHLEPEILIIDEVLAVGDAEFQKRCMGKMQDVAKGGRTVLFVSHNMAAVTMLCDTGVLLRAGKIVKNGCINSVIEQYLASRQTEAANNLDLSKYRQSGMTEVIRNVEMQNSDGASVSEFGVGEAATVLLSYSAERSLQHTRFGIRIDSLLGESLLFFQTELSDDAPVSFPKVGTVECRIPSLPLIPGMYRITCGCSSRGQQVDALDECFTFSITPSNYLGVGKLPSTSQCKFVVPSKWRVTPA